MLGKEDMAVRLAKLEWTLDTIIAGVDHNTKERIKSSLIELQKDVILLGVDHKAPRPRRTQDEIAQSNEPPAKQTSFPTDREQDS